MSLETPTRPSCCLRLFLFRLVAVLLLMPGFSLRRVATRQSCLGLSSGVLALFSGRSWLRCSSSGSSGGRMFLSSSSSSPSPTPTSLSASTTHHDAVVFNLDKVDESNCNLEELSALQRPRVLFVLGGPGAGKGTQCAKLSSAFGMKHLSAGELLREERLSGSSNGQLIESYLKEGKIVPVQITLDLLKKAMLDDTCNRFLIDGFPRNWDNLDGWEKCMPGVCDVEAVMFIDCPEAELEKRLLSRGQTSGRSDDNLETARKRFATFRESTMPVVDHYAKQDKLIRVSGAEGVEEVFESLKNSLTPFIETELLALSQVLLNAVATSNWPLYSSLCDGSLTAFEKEANGELARGIGFHKPFFSSSSYSSSSSSSSSSLSSTSSKEAALLLPVMRNASVRVMGTSAVVTYTRVEGDKKDSFNETRVWQLIQGRWKHVHMHRSPSHYK